MGQFNLSHQRLMSFDMGSLVPICAMEVLPGDAFRHAVQLLMRTTPLLAPLMHQVNVHVDSFFVPNRIIWDNWEDFITTANNETLTIPAITVGNSGNADGLAEHMGVGVPLGVATININALPFRAYNKIVNEFYYDQDIQTPLTETTGDSDSAATYSIRTVNWPKDRFTTARATEQQGATAERVRVSTDADTGDNIGIYSTFVDATRKIDTDLSTADLSATSESIQMFTDINDWRVAMATQRIREHRARYGSRYRDYLAFLGVNAMDSRLDRPEVLSRSRRTVAFSEVIATAETGTSVDVGDLKGHGISALRARPYRRFFREHGWIISLMYVRPKAVYNDSCSRSFFRNTWDDFWQKELEMLGPEPVQNREVYTSHATPTGTHGYASRHDDYRHGHSSVSGNFRSSLDHWHLGRQFTSDTALNESFLQCNPSNRVFASTSVDEIQTMIGHNVTARRLVSSRGRNG